MVLLVMYNWIVSILSSRRQRVIVKYDASDFKCMKSVIPQRIVLGTLYFRLFIIDLPDEIKSTCKIFADDTKV